MKHSVRSFGWLVLVGVSLVVTAFAQSPPPAADSITFSVDPASPAINGFLTPDDILRAGPSVVVHGTSLNLRDNFFGGLFDNLDALSYGCDPILGPVFFSVDRVAVGLPGSAVFDQAMPGVASAAGDIFMALPPFGTNILVVNETDLGLQPGFFGDDVDALDMYTLPQYLASIYFSIDDLSVQNGSGTLGLAGNIYLNSFGYIFADGVGDIRLDVRDDLDALVLWDQVNPGTLDPGADKALFSLSKFSPSTFTGGSGPWSPGDILFTDFTGPPTLWASAELLGLRPDDELDALSTIPEPGQLVHCALIVAFGLCIRHRNRKHP